MKQFKVYGPPVPDCAGIVEFNAEQLYVGLHEHMSAVAKQNKEMLPPKVYAQLFNQPIK